FSSALAAPLIFLAEKSEWLMVHAIDPISRWAVASIRIPHYHGAAALVYLLYFILLAMLVWPLARWNPLRPPQLVGGNAKPVLSARMKIVCGLFGLLLCLIVFHPFSTPAADGKLHVDFLDVGPGDSALCTMPDGSTLLVDGGGKPNIDWARGEDADAEAFERDTRSI